VPRGTIVRTMSHLRSCLVAILCVTSLLSAARGDDAAAPPATPKANADAVDGLPALKKLFDGGRLRLSNDDQSAAKAFYFTLTGWVRTPPGRADIAVWRDGDKLLVWSWSYPAGDDRPESAIATCAAADGLFVGLDPKNPGGLVLFQGGHPEVVLAGAADKQSADFRVRYRPAGADAARVLFDGRTLIQSTFPRMLSASLDAQQGLIKVKTEKATVDVKPAGEKRPCALDYVMITGEQQAVTFYVPPEPPKPQPLVGQLTAQAVKALGLPLRTLTADDEAAFRPYFDVPVADFQTDPRHRQAAMKLWSLLQEKGEEKKFEPKLSF